MPGTGDESFEHSYSYSSDGNLLSWTIDGDQRVYSYPDAGDDRPHAPVGVGSDSYRWDEAGNLVERTVDGELEEFGWDVEGRLAAVDTDNSETGFVYDVEGQRLLRSVGDQATLYVAGHEAVAVDGDIVEAVRSYSFGGELVATRSTRGVSYMAADAAGSLEAAMDDGGEVTGSRTYSPYGEVRSEQGDEFDTEQGFLGRVEDPTTDLSYLDARYYDTRIGVFISTDPLYDLERPRTLNPYSYAGGNPTTWTDPDGLSPAYIYGLERQNASLQGQVEFLSAVAVWQAAHIRNLEASLAYVKRVAKWQAGRIRQLENQVEFLESVARWQSAVINNQRQTIWNQAIQINQLNATINTLQHTIHQLTRPRHTPNGSGTGSGGGGGPRNSGGRWTTVGGGGNCIQYRRAGLTQSCAELDEIFALLGDYYSPSAPSLSPIPPRSGPSCRFEWSWQNAGDCIAAGNDFISRNAGSVSLFISGNWATCAGVAPAGALGGSMLSPGAGSMLGAVASCGLAVAGSSYVGHCAQGGSRCI